MLPCRRAPVQDSCGSSAAAICFNRHVRHGKSADEPGIRHSSESGGHREGLPFIYLTADFLLGTTLKGNCRRRATLTRFPTTSARLSGITASNSVAISVFSNLTSGSITTSMAQYIWHRRRERPCWQATSSPTSSGADENYIQGSAQDELVRSKAFYFFAQDSWKMKSNLTLNYGFRWELNTPLADIG